MPQKLLIMDDGMVLFLMPDTGCEASSSCLSCPLPQCKHDDPEWFRRHVQGQRDRRIAAEYEALDLPTVQAVNEIAQKRRISVRAVYKILQRVQRERNVAAH